MRSKTKIKIGDSLNINERLHVIQDMFVADGTRWVYCSILKRRNKVKYNSKIYSCNSYDTTYLTETEWIKEKKKTLV